MYFVTWFIFYYTKPHKIVYVNVSSCSIFCLLSWGDVEKCILSKSLHIYHGCHYACIVAGGDIQLLHCSHTGFCRLGSRRNFQVKCERRTRVDISSFVLLEAELGYLEICFYLHIFEISTWMQMLLMKFEE